MSMQTELYQVEVNTAITFRERQYTVRSAMTLQELYQPGGSSSWMRRNKESEAIGLTSSLLLARIPVEESGNYHWLACHLLQEASSLREFFKGGDSPGEWGPARRFGKQGQTGEVLYRLLDAQWQVRDIGAFEAQVKGDNPWIKDGDRLYFVTSQGVNESRWLWYLDARPGEARGTGGLFSGEVFDPEEAITEVL